MYLTMVPLWTSARLSDESLDRAIDLFVALSEQGDRLTSSQPRPSARDQRAQRRLRQGEHDLSIGSQIPRGSGEGGARRNADTRPSCRA